MLITDYDKNIISEIIGGCWFNTPRRRSAVHAMWDSHDDLARTLAWKKEQLAIAEINARQAAQALEVLVSQERTRYDTLLKDLWDQICPGVPFDAGTVCQSIVSIVQSERANRQTLQRLYEDAETDIKDLKYRIKVQQEETKNLMLELKAARKDASEFKTLWVMRNESLSKTLKHLDEVSESIRTQRAKAAYELRETPASVSGLSAA